MITHEKNKVRGSNAKSSQRHVLSHNNTDNDLDIKRDQQDESVDTALRKKCDGNFILTFAVARPLSNIYFW